jgi:hypothetical protein
MRETDRHREDTWLAGSHRTILLSNPDGEVWKVVSGCE